MIEIHYQMLDDGRHELKMTGHANGPRSDQGDLVCCAASMLAYTLAMRLQELQQDGRCSSVTMRLESGDAYLAASPASHCSCRLAEAYRTVLAGYDGLQKQYPECVRLLRT